MRILHLFAAITICAVSIFAGALMANDNWPQWRGTDWDNISHESGLPNELNPDRNLLWRVELPGPGGASPVVWEDRAFVTSIDDEGQIWLLCFGTNGEERWRVQLKGENQRSRDNANSASPSPCTDGKHVWATSTAGYLECFDMQGNRVWSIDLQQRFGEFHIQFGMTSTPILDNGRLYHQLIHGRMRDRSTTSEGTIVAIDAMSGKTIWRHTRKTDAVVENKHSYASPTIYRDESREFLITHGGDYVIGHDLEDGSELWRCGRLNPKGGQYNPFLRFVASPVCADGKIVVPSAKNGPVLCLKPNLSGNVTEKDSAFHWVLKRGTPDVSTPLLVNDLVFLTRENGALSVVDANSGDLIDTGRMFADRHRSTPVAGDGKVYIAARDGTMYALTADREHDVLSSHELGEETTASPAVADGRIYIRTFEALYCFGDRAN